MAKKDLSKKSAPKAKGTTKGKERMILSNKDLEMIIKDIRAEESQGKNYESNIERSNYNIGLLLIKVKGRLPDGVKFEDWVKENFGFGVRNAQRWMKIARKYNDANPVSLLGIAKAYILLKLPDEEREAIIANGLEIDGVMIPAHDVSKRDLEIEIRKLKGLSNPEVKSGSATGVGKVRGNIQRLLNSLGDDKAFSALRSMCEEALETISATNDESNAA